MQLYSFRSTGTQGLHAFTGDRSGERLPTQCGPWTLTGEVLEGRSPPFGLSRSEIEKGIAREGFQLWRTKSGD